MISRKLYQQDEGSVEGFLDFETCLFEQAEEGLIGLLSGFAFLLNFTQYFGLNLFNHGDKFFVGLLSLALLLIDLSMQPVELLLYVFCKLGSVMFPFFGLRLDTMLQFKNALFHFLCDHFDCLAFLVCHLFQTIANLY